MFDANRRKYPRANYPCQLTIWPAQGPTQTILANTSNVGSGGLSVHLDQEISTGATIDIQLHFNNTTTPFKCKGVVMRCGRENDKFYNTGIQFEPLNELEQVFLEGKVAEIIALESKGNK